MNLWQPESPPFAPGDRVLLRPRSTLWAAGVRVGTIVRIVSIARHVRRLAARCHASVAAVCRAVFAEDEVPKVLAGVRWPVLRIEPVPRWPAGGEVMVRPSTIEKADVPLTRD
jgi:hypothetical protein